MLTIDGHTYNGFDSILDILDDALAFYLPRNLARNVGVTPETVARWISRAHAPTAAHASAIHTAWQAIPAGLDTYEACTRPERNPTGGECLTIIAESVEDAAQKAAVRINPDARHVYAVRVTGDRGKSGVFQGFRPLRHSGGDHNTSVGPRFHVG